MISRCHTGDKERAKEMGRTSATPYYALVASSPALTGFTSLTSFTHEKRSKVACRSNAVRLFCLDARPLRRRPRRMPWWVGVAVVVLVTTAAAGLWGLCRMPTVAAGGRLGSTARPAEWWRHRRRSSHVMPGRRPAALAEAV